MAKRDKQRPTKKQDGPFLAVAVDCESIMEDKDGVLSAMRMIDTVKLCVPPDTPDDNRPARSARRIGSARRLATESERDSDLGVVVHGHMSIAARDAHVAVSDCISDLGQRSAAGQGVADQRVPAAVNGQRLDPAAPKTLPAVRNRFRSGGARNYLPARSSPLRKSTAEQNDNLLLDVLDFAFRRLGRDEVRRRLEVHMPRKSVVGDRRSFDGQAEAPGLDNVPRFVICCRR